jgi:hypothetical protein
VFDILIVALDNKEFGLFLEKTFFCPEMPHGSEVGHTIIDMAS